MPKIRIVIASVLKPVDDPRMLAKMGASLARTGFYDIHIIGSRPKVLPAFENIIFHPIFKFKRLELKRLFAGFKYLRKLISLQPDLIIFNTHELLVYSVVYRFFHKVKLMYDIRENYYLNIRYGQGFGFPVNLLIAIYVRMKEKLFSNFIDHFILAEVSYLNELSFIKKQKSTVVANKFAGEMPNPDGNRKSGKRMIYSGTIAREYGVEEAITMVDRLRNLDPDFNLHIIGFCAKNSYWKRLLLLIEQRPWIKVTGGSYPVPHSQILEALQSSGWALLPYHPLPHLLSCMPTKVYECIALKIPMVLTDHQPWVAFCDQFHAAIPVNFENYDAKQVYKELFKTYFDKDSVASVLWSDEEAKFLQIIHSLLPAN